MILINATIIAFKRRGRNWKVRERRDLVGAISTKEYREESDVSKLNELRIHPATQKLNYGYK